MKNKRNEVCHRRYKLGLVPKISIDPRVELCASQVACAKEPGTETNIRRWENYFCTLSDEAGLTALAMQAGIKVLSALREAYSFIEVIKISYTAGYTDHDMNTGTVIESEPRIRVALIFTEPISEKKIEIGIVRALMAGSVMEPSNSMLDGLVSQVCFCLSKKVADLREKRKDELLQLEAFDKIGFVE